MAWQAVAPDMRASPAARLRMVWRREAFPWILVSPVAALVAIGVLFPLGYVLLLGSYDYSPYLGRPAQYVGAQNYRTLITDRAFWSALGASLIWVVGSVVPQF